MGASGEISPKHSREEGVCSHYREGVRPTAIYDREWLIPIMTDLLTIHIVGDLSWNILIFQILANLGG